MFTVQHSKKNIESIIDFTTDFTSIVKSRHNFTVKSSALDLCLILLSNQLLIKNCDFSLCRVSVNRNVQSVTFHHSGSA